MLNTRYVLQDTRGSGVQPIPTQTDLGNAWFVNEYELVDDANAEMTALSTLEPRTKAVIQKRYADYLKGLKIQPDSAATIVLTEYQAEKLTYSYNIATEQLAVFSEVFYAPEKGWNVYIDNKKVAPFIKANYVVRAMRLPAGSHTIEMKFEPRSYYTGSTIGIIASILVFVLFFGGLYLYFKNKSTETTETYEIDDPVANAKMEKKPLRKTESRTTKGKRKK
jgi:hypothetical protein